MADINGFTVANSVLDKLQLPGENSTAATEENPNDSLDQADFLKLLVTQLENQNPLQPQEGTEFVAQLAQFSVVQGIGEMNTNFTDMANSFRSSQAIQATAMVGRTVLVPGSTGRLPDGGEILGSVEISQPVDDLLINVYDLNGLVVRQDVVGAQDVGNFRFVWDGRNADGDLVPPGTYRFDAYGLVDDETVGLPMSVSANVNSVTIGRTGEMTLNVDGVGPVSVSAVQEIL